MQITTDSPVSADATPAPLHAQGATNHRALTPIHWWDGCDIRPHKSERLTSLAPLAAAYYTGEAAAVIQAAKGKTGHGDIAHAWGLAMGAIHGPIGAHETQGEHPEVVKFKARCLAGLRAYLSV